jgi:hypothetical protein
MHKRKAPKKSAVALAVASLDGTPNPLDQDMSAVSLDRTSLDLPEGKYQEVCSRCGSPAVERRPECGSPLCGDCAAGDEG